jgi:tetratricopeptide (TPR) repeat protein
MRARCFDFRLSVLSAVATGLLAFAVPAAATVTSGGLAPATSLDDAWRACNAPQPSSADRIAYCTTIIESGRALGPARAQALMVRGLGYVFQKDLDRALADFDAAIRSNPKLAAGYYYRGAIQMERDPKRALADINKAISLNPKDPD